MRKVTKHTSLFKVALLLFISWLAASAMLHKERESWRLRICGGYIDADGMVNELCISYKDDTLVVYDSTCNKVQVETTEEQREALQQFAKLVSEDNNLEKAFKAADCTLQTKIIYHCKVWQGDALVNEFSYPGRGCKHEGDKDFLCIYSELMRALFQRYSTEYKYEMMEE